MRSPGAPCSCAIVPLRSDGNLCQCLVGLDFCEDVELVHLLAGLDAPLDQLGLFQTFTQIREEEGRSDRR